MGKIAASSSIEAARVAFEEFERDMTASDAIGSFREGLEYALYIIEAIDSDIKSKERAKNLIGTYRRKLIERISDELNDAGTREDEHYDYWMRLANVFQEAGYDEDKRLSQLVVKLAVKPSKTWNKEKLLATLRTFQRELDDR